MFLLPTLAVSDSNDLLYFFSYLWRRPRRNIQLAAAAAP